MAHSNGVPELAAGVKALADGNGAFAHTQALWRFLSNERVTCEALSEPLLACARQEVVTACDAVVLAVCDWSRLHFRTHTRKLDRYAMSHDTDVGYELQSTLLVSDRDGSPLAAPVQNLVTAEGVWQSRQATLAAAEPHLDEATQRMEYLEEQALGRPIVHMIDREADSVAHLRQWQARNWRYLVRAKGGSRVKGPRGSSTLTEVGAGLTYRLIGAVTHQGKKAEQWVGGTTVTLTRPAKPKRRDAQGKRVKSQPGPPLTLRLVISRVQTAQGQTLAEWFLLSNVDAAFADERLALWYYWRWQIESYFKLLKQAGHQLEHWGQETGLALLKRLLIVAQACVMAWRLMRAQTPAAQNTRSFLVRLSGRQMKRSTPVTAPALLDGLFKLFTMLELLEHHSIDELRAHAHQAFPTRFKRHSSPVV